MCIRTLAEALDRLERGVFNNIDDIDTPEDLYNKYEMTAISILDSNFDAFPDEELELFLKYYLAFKAEQLLGEEH